MTREEYLMALKNNLSALTIEEQNEALQYYSDYFEEADDDEKIMGELGSPEEIAKSIIEKCANAVAKKDGRVSEGENHSDTDSETEGADSADGETSDALFYSYKKKDVKNLSLNFGAAEIVLITGSEYAIETRGIDKAHLNCSLSSDGSLFVSNSKSINLDFWNHDRRQRLVPRILVSVPEKSQVRKLKIALGAGNLRSKDFSLAFDEGVFEVGAGNISLQGVEGGRADIRCGMGNCNVKGSLVGKVNIDCGMGNVSLNLKGNPQDYSYDLKLGLGEFRFNDVKKSGVSRVIENERKANNFSVNCGMGNVNIKIS